MKPILYKAKLVFPPIGQANQLTDILELTAPNYEAIRSKVEYIGDNLDRLTKVNDSIVYAPEISGNNIFYYLSKGGEQYYYPIQYAKFEFSLKTPKL